MLIFIRLLWVGQLYPAFDNYTGEGGLIMNFLRRLGAFVTPGQSIQFRVTVINYSQGQ